MTDPRPSRANAAALHAAGGLLIRRGLAMQDAALAQLAGAATDTPDDAAAALTAEAIGRGHRVTGDGYTSEAAAADLLGIAPSTLRQWHNEREPIPWRRGAGGRVQYALSDLADYLALARKTGC